MATTTPNLGLRQPAGTDFVSVLQDISNNMEILDSEVFGRFALDTAPDIPNNSNFNSLITPGSYRVRSYSSAVTMTNIPEATAGTLYVKNSMLEHGANYRQQIYHTYQNKIYLRMSSNAGSTWTAWEELVKNYFSAVVFTPESGITNNLFIRRFGRVVIVNGYLTSSTAFGENQKVGTIESGARPVTVVRFLAGVANAAYLVGDIAYVAIDQAGNVTITAKSGNTYKNCYFSASYIVQS